MSQKHVKLTIIVFAILIIALVGITYAFFNYTRTGSINNIGTGRIVFNSSQSNTLNITNYFPMTSSEAGEANLDSVTISITGDTTYVDGEEYEISLVDVTNTVNGKSIPINYIATYTATAGNTVGTGSSNYWNVREDKDDSIYLLNATGEVEEGKQVLVGYIDNGATGINGTLTISAYIDGDRIAISDTYDPDHLEYVFNPNITQTGINDCVSYLTDIFGQEEENNTVDNGETYQAFCSGTGTIWGDTFQDCIEYGDYWYEEDVEYFLEHNIILQKNYSDDTTSEWVDGRTVLTTSEWNSLENTPISFKIRAESNEGIWVEGAPTMAEMCPDCVFTHTINNVWTTWNNQGITPTVLTSADYEENYEDVISSSGKNTFLGLKLNENNQVEKAYSCGLYNGITPFCIEGYYDNSKLERNQAILQNKFLWDNTCSEINGQGEHIYMCSSPSSGLASARVGYDGKTMVAADIMGDTCHVSVGGLAACGIAIQ